MSVNTEQQALSLEDYILSCLSEIHVGDATGPDIVSCGQVYDVVVTDGAARILLDMERVSEHQESALTEIITPLVESIPGVKRAIIKPRPRSIASRASMPGIGYVIGVHSGKGGVGKSTLTVNLAVALSAMGLRVGVLDADVYGPSIPTLLGIKGRAEMNQAGDRIEPMQAYGLKLMSLGFLLPEDQALIWRGSLVDQGLPQLFNDIEWGELDVLLVDLPPGTSDVHLAVAQSVQLSGVLTVTAPGQLSIDDVRRGLEMFADIAVPSLGLVENMAGVVCQHCHQQSDLFGAGGALGLSQQTGIALLARLPFIPEVAIGSDHGKPIAAGNSVQAQAFHALAANLAQQLKLNLVKEVCDV